MAKVSISKLSWIPVWDEWGDTGLRPNLMQWMHEKHGCRITNISEYSVELVFESSERAIEFMLKYS